MAVFTLNLFDISLASTDDPLGFDDNGGYQFDLGVDTLTIQAAASAQAVLVDDTGDATFDDDAGAAQTLAAATVINGTLYGAGTVIESEYELDVRDGGGQAYTLQFVSLSGNAFSIEAFVIQGVALPFGEALTIVGRHDNTQGVHSYLTSLAPICFAAPTRIATTRGLRPAEQLRRGEWLLTERGRSVRLEMMLRVSCQQVDGPTLPPVRVRSGALGAGLPLRALCLSAQHRVRLPLGDRGAGKGPLVPAKALIALRGVGWARELAGLDYVHLVTSRHEVLQAEGVGCESFWPGPQSMRALPPVLRAKVRAVMGAAPERAGRFLGAAKAQRVLARRGIHCQGRACKNAGQGPGVS
ncbi:hypothetical protein AYJ57_03050 [Salipiger sp. CCB-MM3]|uniref:Hint domain-containing protein n=1 Tax=Salipiger sp. CCB-MM3 TaxID=1792508 RepID=UPI00080AA696|nr:Hint domain-containing protein [Salipiger sp. CCB-MM3]ANT59428.1 hypothetical protein AYJ57_03050 [Salipiger sp. CCB-MM3]